MQFESLEQPVRFRDPYDGATTVMPQLTVCRACRSRRLHLFLPMGEHPPANLFLTREQLERPEPTFPLDAQACLDCGLIQVADQIPADFFRHYLYVPSASEGMHRHFAGLATKLAACVRSARSGPVVDIGCNDGLLLKACRDLGLAVLGIEPASNLAKVARAKGVEVVNEYFTPAVAADVRKRYGAAAAIVTTNTFNHIGDLHSFTEGVRRLLDDRGIFVIEVPDALELLDRNEFDTIYHEHVSEFSLSSLVRLCDHFDMEIFDVERLSIHGGSMRIFVQNKDDSSRSITSHVTEWLAREREGGLFSSATYDAFAERVRRNRAKLLSILHELKSAGHKIAGYGAPAKGNTLLNYFGIGPDMLDFLADLNELKHGLYSPGMHVPIVPTETILQEQPDYLMVLAWNFADEIIAQQQEYRSRGGKFILPIPEPVVVG